MTGNTRFTVWMDRSTQSIFGAACTPVNRNGVTLIFDDEECASAECTKLNARAGGSHVRYSVKKEGDFDSTSTNVALPESYAQKIMAERKGQPTG
jgi:hypothetical protein